MVWNKNTGILVYFSVSAEVNSAMQHVNPVAQQLRTDFKGDGPFEGTEYFAFFVKINKYVSFLLIKELERSKRRFVYLFQR